MLFQGKKRMLCIKAGNDKSLPTGVRGFGLYLGQFVNRAMFEGMTRLGFGIDRKTHEPWMQFFGPYCSKEPVWFDVVPPDSYFYPMALKACFSLAHLGPKLPIEGIIPAVKGRVILDLALEIHDIYSFQLSWGAEYCGTWMASLADPYPAREALPRGVGAVTNMKV